MDNKNEKTMVLTRIIRKEGEITHRETLSEDITPLEAPDFILKHWDAQNLPVRSPGGSVLIFSDSENKTEYEYALF